MIVSVKDGVKLFGIAVIACCAVFVCALFLNYTVDIAGIKEEITEEAGMVMYQAQFSMSKVVCAVSGGCLTLTSVVMLLFYVKNYIDGHKKELGILKAMGYAPFRTAKHFWVFGISVFLGALLGFGAAFLYLPTFYRKQNAEGLFPPFEPSFHPLLFFSLVCLPALLFMLLSVLYACMKLKAPVSGLLWEKQEHVVRRKEKTAKDLPFLDAAKKTVRNGKKTLVFFIAFSAFCFSAMTQMALSMYKLESETFAWMIITIGLILAFMTLFLSLSTVVSANAKTIAMMRVLGYCRRQCSRTVLGGYRPVSYIGFAAGTLYQYLLLKIVLTVFFAGVETIPAYSFDFVALAVSGISFVITYELILYAYSLRIRRLSLKSIMLE